MPGLVYPLSLDQRILQRDLFYQDATTLYQTLDQIRATCTKQCSTPFSECSEHLTAAIEAYRIYYLNPGPGRWHSDLHEYHEELQVMFDRASSSTMEEIHSRAAREFRQYTKQDLCTPNSSDPPPIANNKLTTAHMLDDGVPIDNCIDQYLNALSQLSPNEETARFLYGLQNATTPEARTQLYIDHYCTGPVFSDSTKLANFKAKYARQFRSGATHDTVVSAMKAEAEGSKSADVSGLQIRLGELQMAQSAHLKSVARKAEKDQKMRDASPPPVAVKVESEMVECAIQGCERKVLVEGDEDFGGPIECGLCDWLAGKVEGRKRCFYCSREHAEMDFVSFEPLTPFPSLLF